MLIPLSNLNAQVVIKERINIHPGDSKTINQAQSGCVFGNCSYYDCDSGQIYIQFSPTSVEPGGSAIMKLWITPNQYEYNEENYDIIQKTITIEPECGQLTYFGRGEYLFTAPDTLTVDSFVVTINYENYNQFCAGWDAKGERMIIKDNVYCIDCPIPLFSILWRDYATGQITIKWDSLYVEVDPPELFPGDTADVIIKKRLFDGTLTDFDTSQTYEAAMLEGCTLGNILVDDSLDVYFYDVNQPIKFIADTTADSTGLVLLRIGLVEETLLRKSNNSDEVDLFDCLPGPPQTTKYKIVQTEVKEEPTILLGETKYYQAKYVGPLLDELIIEEVTEPELNGGLEVDIWGENPVTIVQGDSLGVYWEKEKPIYGTNPQETLPEGLIRLVGRHWSEEQTYKVKLTAKNGPDEPNIEITVEAPDQLGNNIYATDLNNGIDVSSNDYSVDSVCIKWGGQYGFPPQYIKGQYSIESVYDSDLGRVCPVYRYEPWKTEFEVRNTDYENGHFWVTEESMGNGNPVPNHDNTRYMSYVTAPHSIWYFIEQYTNIVQNPSPYGGEALFGYKRISDNKLIFNLYRRPRNEYASIRTEIYQNLGLDPEIENSDANEQARQEFITFMTTEYEGGLETTPAQTRIASSYGPVQLLYDTAVRRGFSEASGNPPENLNVMDIFWPFAMNHFQFLLSQEIGNDLNNWTNGFEATLHNVYHNWNPGIAAYPDEIFQNSRQFTPMKSEGE